MSFSYSDENFTVVGNLCFVHIVLNGTERMIDIPPAIVDRMLFDNIVCVYTYNTEKVRVTSDVGTVNTSFAKIRYGKIMLKELGDGYLYCYFPIDSNK